ncbi:MAG TPA: hypothetical protein VNF27_09790 [Candidatus Binataceae bacterium]|nr:hypothetical protein [Candidatus Binataceae bacterium]
MSRSAHGKVIPLRVGSIVQDEPGVPQSRLWDSVHPGDPRPFPMVNTLPRLPVAIPDEILDYYGWVFCQGGFLNLQMTFEQFLAVVAAVSPAGLCPEYDPSDFASISD